MNLSEAKNLNAVHYCPRGYGECEQGCAYPGRCHAVGEVKHPPKVDHTPAKLDAASKLLLKAAGLIEERGLAKHALLAASGSMCALGAINMATNGTEFGQGEPENLEARRRLESSIGSGRIPRWNNAEERTQVEVVSKLRAVALGIV